MTSPGNDINNFPEPEYNYTPSSQIPPTAPSIFWSDHPIDLSLQVNQGLPRSDGGPIEAVKTAVVLALRDALQNTSIGIQTTNTQVHVNLEYPMKEEQYPGLWIQFQTSKLQRQGLGQEVLQSLPAVNAVQTITIGGSPTGGTFTLSYKKEPTTNLTYHDTSADVQTALQALGTIGAGNVLVTGNNGGPFTITFTGDLAGQPVPLLVATNGLIGDNAPYIQVQTITTGAPAGWQAIQEWYFEGKVTMTIMALTSLERDRISDSIITQFAFARTADGVITQASDTKQFKNFLVSLYSNPFISITINQDILNSGGQSVNMGTPWQEDVLAYVDSYSFDLLGQFMYVFNHDGTYTLANLNEYPNPISPPFPPLTTQYPFPQAPPVGPHYNVPEGGGPQNPSGDVN